MENPYFVECPSFSQVEVCDDIGVGAKVQFYAELGKVYYIALLFPGNFDAALNVHSMFC